MPNWTYNKIKCKKELADKLLSKNEDNDFVLDFNKIIPMPESLNLVAGSLEDKSISAYYLSLNDDEQYKLKKKLKNSKTDFYGTHYDKYYRDIQDYINKPERLENDKKNFMESKYREEYKVNTLEELGKKYIDNIRNYGHTQWYEWCVDNWGTKWNVEDNVDVDFNHDKDEYEITFYTAWDCPRGIMKKYYDMCKDNEFDWIFKHEDEIKAHHITNINGIFKDEEIDDDREFVEIEI